MDATALRALLGEVADFPRRGILFYDISPILAHAEAWAYCLAQLESNLAAHSPEILVGVESRGFLLAAPLADRLGLGFVMARKAGKLPGSTVGLDYALEYGQARMELQTGALPRGARTAVVDDLLATGGTLETTLALVKSCGGEAVASACLLELGDLGGRARLGEVPFHSLLTV